MAHGPRSDGEQSHVYFWMVFDEFCGRVEQRQDRLLCFDKLVLDRPHHDPRRSRPPLNDVTIARIFESSEREDAARPHLQPTDEVVDVGEEAIATPLWARIFADIGFFVSVAFLVWMLNPIGRNYALPTSFEGVIGLIVSLAFLLVCAFLINLLPILVVAQATPFGARNYDAFERWLGWLWKWRKRPVDAEWAAIGSYSGSVYADYLQSEQWRKRREIMLRKADHRCQLCSSKVRLQVHHRTYERIFNEHPIDLVVLCRTCHEKFHDIKRY